MATFAEVIRMALERGHGRFQPVNPNIMEVARPNKSRPAYIKIRVPEEIALTYLASDKPKEAGFLIFFGGDVLNEIARELDDKKIRGGMR